MVRWIGIFALLAVVSGDFLHFPRGKRQVTYQADENQDIDEITDDHSVRPVTKKPLPLQLVYPGDLSSFFSTESPQRSPSVLSNLTSTNNNKKSITREQSNRTKRSSTLSRNTQQSQKAMKSLKPLLQKSRLPLQLESRLHASYHKPSVSIMNDIPVEMSFDGAGFLRYEEDFEEDKPLKPRNPAVRSQKVLKDNNHALDDFRTAFNISRERMLSQVKFDDDITYQKESPIMTENQENVMEQGSQGTETIPPPAIDFMTAYQHGVFGNGQLNYPTASTQLTQTDPFSFSYPTFIHTQQNMNQMASPVAQPESFMQNHRVQSTNFVSTNPLTMHSALPQQSFTVNPGYTQNANLQYHKVQRRKRSASNSDATVEREISHSASEPIRDHYSYSQPRDQQDSSSGFIPITGGFNGGTIQLSFPFYGQAPMLPPSYSSRPPIHTISSYSLPVTEGRHYRGTMERFYHPSEARRYSY
ncbi:hypothetical protein X975_12098, partial [Stegodyphus mimosarum]